MSITFSGDQIEQVCQLTIRCFTQDELARLVRVKLDFGLEAVDEFRNLESGATAVRAEVDDRLMVRAGRSDVPGATSRELYDKTTNRTVIVLRRYDFEKGKTWISTKFPLQSVRSLQIATSDPALHIGCLVLNRV